MGLLTRAPITLGALKQGVLDLHQEPIDPQLAVLAARNHIGGSACKAEVHQGGDLSSFIKDPRLFRTRLMNFVLMGGAGTGKTTLAQAIGDVFARSGMFVGDNLILAGRGELVGQ